ncbi:MAG: tripartite tricarboxylate transporter substrate binding protein [Burkholderiaceae bacterium]
MTSAHDNGRQRACGAAMTSISRRSFSVGALALGLAATRAFGQADDFPNKPVRIIVPFAAGGPTDAMTRILASRLTDELRQQVIVENRPGAGGNIGAEYVAHSEPNGYTLLLGTNGTLAANKSLFEKLGYDPDVDFAPVSMFLFQPNLLGVNPAVPARNVKELIDWLKANPGQTYASGGLGTSTHFSGELFRTMTGVNIQHVPYKGDGPSVPDVVAGNVPMVFCSVHAGMKWIDGGRLRVLGVTSATRVPVISQIPTIAESGLPGFDLTSWYSIVTPAATPKDIIDHLNAGIRRSLADPGVKSKLEAMGSILAPGTPEQLRAHVQAETPRWAALVRQANIRL